MTIQDNLDVVRLVDVEGLSYEEAAKKIGVPIGTIMARLHRGHQYLNRKLPYD